jgi:hypothetical protein
LGHLDIASGSQTWSEERETVDLLKSGESSERNDIMYPILVFNKRKTNLGRTATGAGQSYCRLLAKHEPLSLVVISKCFAA